MHKCLIQYCVWLSHAISVQEHDESASACQKVILLCQTQACFSATKWPSYFFYRIASLPQKMFSNREPCQCQFPHRIMNRATCSHRKSDCLGAENLVPGGYQVKMSGHHQVDLVIFSAMNTSAFIKPFKIFFVAKPCPLSMMHHGLA